MKIIKSRKKVYKNVLAKKLSQKKDERYDVIMRYMRVKLSFLSLKATLLCLRGTRRERGGGMRRGLQFLSG